ncbi:DUF4054 domain-containing protein [Paenibacillus glucanolyticus]|uniref:DUF4054 domain-containing protein n=1 Tax=Paenibacillus glucanolyticus TaxID=59843 RepID=UPI0035DB5DDD
MTTTPQKVRGIAKHLSGLSDEDLQLYIDDSYQDVISLYKAKDESYHERLTRYLAAHMASLNIRRVTSQKVDGMQMTYESGGKDGDGLESTEYGLEFLRLLNRSNGSLIPLMVL